MQADAVVKLPTFYAEDTAASANEVWSRIHSDPLFAVSHALPGVPPLPCNLTTRSYSLWLLHCKTLSVLLPTSIQIGSL